MTKAVKRIARAGISSYVTTTVDTAPCTVRDILFTIANAAAANVEYHDTGSPQARDQTAVAKLCREAAEQIQEATRKHWAGAYTKESR